MKRYILKLGVVIGAILIFASCGKDFLQPPVIDYVTEEHKNELTQDPKVLADILDANLAASYTVVQSSWRSHDDFGLKALQLALDMYGEDIAYYGGWFQFDYMLDNYMANYRRTNSTWGQMYELISNTNLMLRDYFVEGESNPDILRLKATPVALRGIALYYLVNFYQATYVGNESKPGVPVPLKPEDEFLARSTVKEVYEQIISDLTFAVENAAETSSRTDVDRSVAAAYLAKAYAHMENWAKVEEFAKIAQKGGTDAVMKYPPNWSVTNSDVLWGYDVSPVTSTLWASFYSHMDPTLPNYAGGGQIKYIYNWLYDKMGDKDVRKTLFVNNDLYPDIAEQNGLATYTDDEGNVQDFTYAALKYKTSHNDGLNADYVFLRVQDPILLEIEALVEQNKVGEAATKLQEFVEKRDVDYTAPTTQNELREEVRIQRRIELWAEGSALFDFKRWKQEIDRTKTVYVDPEDGKTKTTSNHGAIRKYDPNSMKYIHKLPQREIDNNKLLEQNPME